MTKTINQDIIQSLNKFKPEDYFNTLWALKIIGPQGSYTLDYLVKNFTITEEAKQFANKHFEKDSEVMEAFQDFYYEVITLCAQSSIISANDGAEEYAWLLDIEEEERFNAAFEDAAEDMNYPALGSFMAYMYDNITLK